MGAAGTVCLPGGTAVTAAGTHTAAAGTAFRLTFTTVNVVVISHEQAIPVLKVCSAVED